MIEVKTLKVGQLLSTFHKIYIQKRTTEDWQAEIDYINKHYHISPAKRNMRMMPFLAQEHISNKIPSLHIQQCVMQVHIRL